MRGPLLAQRVGVSATSPSLPQPVAVFLASGLLIGSAAGVLFRPEDAPLSAELAALAGASAIAAWIVWHHWARWSAVVACLLGVSVGIALGAHAARAALAPELAALAGDDPIVLEGVLRDDAVPSDFGVTCALDVRRVRHDSGWVPISGGVRLTIAGLDAPAARDAWRAGRLARVTATLRRPLPYRNFGTPDQEVRLAWRGVRVFGAVKSAALVEVLARGSPLAEATAAARAWARRTVTAAIGPDDPQGAAIVLAVLIGDRAGLSPEIAST